MKPAIRNLDSAKRFADTVALHQMVLSRDEILARRFLAVRLSDGGTDGVVYETRADAIKAQTNTPSRCFYFQIPFERLNVETCDSILWYARAVYDSGAREDPAHQLSISNKVEGFS